ncbi:MAG: ATP-binding domain-containing protein, partial [Muribaculaceae bacterium]|nr:ATP-binding domain-containing protein [Muribaculaceae bacterium]
LVAFKTVYAHMSVAFNPLRTAEWARLLYQLGCVRRLDDAVALLGEMREAAMTPADLLSADGLSAVERAVVALDSGGTLAPEAMQHLVRLLYPARRVATPHELMRHIEPALRAALSRQEDLMERCAIDGLRSRLNARYGALYRHTQDMLASDEVCEDNTLEAELDHVYGALRLQGRIDVIPRWEAVRALLGSVVTDRTAEPRLREQLAAHLHELCCFNEGDIYDRGLGGRLSVMTVHKAKGLEMDNVIVYNANSCRGSHLDRARIFYVAFSRARRRLAVFCSRHLTPALDDVADFFTPIM